MARLLKVLRKRSNSFSRVVSCIALYIGAMLLFNQKKRILMSTISKFQPAKKATVCFKDNCIIVYDEYTNIVNAIAITASLIIAVSLIAKAIK
jgi:hypothetical protein